jgi:glycosyltransferase involved in cell wall biosynthesis
MRKKITVVIPCHNEARGIRRVITGIPTEKLKKFGYKVEVLVVNNGSTDHTVGAASNAGAIVIDEPRKGKGIALRSGFRSVSQNTKYVVMMDGDNTYKGKELLRMIEPLDSGFCDAVIGSRLGGKLKHNALAPSHRLANWLYTFLVRYLFQANVTDSLSGYFAWKKKSLDKLVPYLESDGFAIEMEMITKMKKLDFDVYSVPITYDRRMGKSKLSSYRDGVRIIAMLTRNLFWKPSSRRPGEAMGLGFRLGRIRSYLNI